MSGFSTLLIETVKSRKSLDNGGVGQLRKLTLANCPVDNECTEVLEIYVRIKLVDKPLDLGLVRIADADLYHPLPLFLANDSTPSDTAFDYFWP